MKMVLAVLVGGALLCAAIPTAQAAPCLMVTVTGSGGGPPTFNGLAGPGTLLRYGDDGNNCNALKMQFDAGRGTNMRLSQLGVSPDQLDAIFFTHMHTDHTEGFADILQLRWHFHSTGPKIDTVCSSRRRVSAGVHDQLQEICIAYCGCIHPVRRDRPASLRSEGACGRGTKTNPNSSGRQLT